MKVVIQRAKNASVSVDDAVVGKITDGLVLLVGVTHEDKFDDASYLVNKIGNLRIFEDDEQKMNLSLKDVQGSVLSVSQFTLYGDSRKGRRPNFMNAAKPEQANIMYKQFNALFEEEGIHVQTGIFGEMMDVQLTNVGPVTMIIDSKDR